MRLFWGKDIFFRKKGDSMDLVPNKQAHLEMIQGIVNRLSQNSFLLKGWSVILISAMFALASKDNKLMFIFLAYFPSILFWCLDGFFLRQERLYRELYDHVRLMEEGEVDFSMDTTTVEANVASWLSCTLSKTLFTFHAVILGSIILVTMFTI